MPRGLTLDPKKKTVIVSDKYMNSVMTFSLPRCARPAVRETARAARQSRRLRFDLGTRLSPALPTTCWLGHIHLILASFELAAM
jgi:hypothetical protein